jgi:hypothetical protein
LSWWELDLLISKFSSRLQFGVQNDVLPLMEIKHIKGFRARALYQAGYTTVASIAAAAPQDLEVHLQNAIPFKSKKNAEDSKSIEYAKRVEARFAKMIVASAQQVLETHAKSLKAEVADTGGTSKQSGSSQSVLLMNLSKAKVFKKELGFSIVSVNNIPALQELVKMCEKQSKFAFSVLHSTSIILEAANTKFNKKMGINPLPPVVIEGLSVCWSSKKVYYIPFQPASESLTKERFPTSFSSSSFFSFPLSEKKTCL